MRRVDHRIEILDAVHAQIGNRGRAALIFLRHELSRPRPRGEILHFVGDRRERFLLRLAHHRRDQPALDGDRDADVGMLVLEHRAFGPGHVGFRHLLQRQRQRLDDEIVDRDLVGRLAVLVLWRGGVDLFARSQKPADVAVEREIKMRNGELRFEEPAGDHLADAVVRDRVVGAGLEQCDDFLVGRRLHDRGRRGCCCGSRRSHDPAARLGCFHIARNNAAVRAGTLDARKVDASLLRKPARQRRRKHAVGARDADTLAFAALRSGSLRCLRWRARGLACRGCRRRRRGPR